MSRRVALNRAASSLIALLAFAMLAAWCLVHAGEIQGRLRDQVSERLAAAGLSGIQVSADGRGVKLAGTLPDEASLDQATRIAATHPGAASLTSFLTVGRPGVRLLSRGGELAISGPMAREATRRRLLDAGATLWGKSYEAGGLRLDPGAPPLRRPDALVSVLALLRDSQGSFDVAWGPPVDVEGEVASEEAKTAFLTRLATLVAGWEIVERIRVVPRAVAAELGRLLAERPVEFASDSARLTARGQALLDEVARLLAGAPEARFLIEGHTDDTGSAEHNLTLSRRRAEAVRDYLAAAGLDNGRFDTQGLGESRPVASNETAAGRRQNRRVEFRLLEEVTP